MQKVAAEHTLDDESRDKISYDATDEAAPRLSYSRVMTVAEKDALLDVANSTTDYEEAIQALFDAPRNFFQRNLSTFSAQLQDFSTPLDALPDGFKLPTS